ncbi:hypothetical protein PGT21_003607 [Puccinia graminis f. sp. tritici]|uniref:Uncharacterized protein n=1 Tax=Puccinia graminis f. sp. tritici TaxID=56615 RepID=A0A5B0QXA5_PUCGR|nr:hypothetical protein PGT21_003607 [Puccinia graminis f. sp. tritici]
MDDASGTIGRAFDSFKGDISVWNWTYFIPQLLSCLSAPREARYAKALLTKIAKAFPQTQPASAQQGGPPNTSANPTQNVATLPNHPPQSITPPGPFPFEHADDIMGTLKTQFPLLALSMEMLVDQLYQRFKAPPEEDVYRLISAYYKRPSL